MNLKLSTSAALALDAIIKAGGSTTDAGDSNAILTDKIASSYQQDVIAINGAVGKRMLQHVQKLQARIKKDDAARTSSAAAAEDHEKSIATIDHRLLPDIGILGGGVGRNLRPEGGMMSNVIKKNDTEPDIGILDSKGGHRPQPHRSDTIFVTHNQHPSQTEPSSQQDGGERYHEDSYYGYSSQSFLCEITNYYDSSGPRLTKKSIQAASSIGTRRDLSHETATEPVFGDNGLPTCRCEGDQLSTCGPGLCNCLQDSQGDISVCLDEVNMLCDGKVSNSTMEQCAGKEIYSALYCKAYPCHFGGGSYGKCVCEAMEHICSTTSNFMYSTVFCPVTECCQSQPDDELWSSCIRPILYDEPYTPPSAPQYTAFQQCDAGSTSTPECACNILIPYYCENYGFTSPFYCDIDTCCKAATDDAGRTECFTSNFYSSCLELAYSKYACLCENASVRCFLTGGTNICQVSSCCDNELFDDGMKSCLDGIQPTPAPTNSVSLISPFESAKANKEGVFAKSGKAKAKTSKTKAAKAKSVKAETEEEDVYPSNIQQYKEGVQYDTLNGASIGGQLLGFFTTTMVALITLGLVT